MALTKEGLPERELVDSLAGAIRQNLVDPAREQLKLLEGRLQHLHHLLEEERNSREREETVTRGHLTRLEEKLARTGKMVWGLAAAAFLLLAAIAYLFTKVPLAG
ncbi:MAG: hypothetical protein IMW93_06150 [Thermoanaerobacteraceae bacterium]|nr:hypothetical protein [Thermoanaerobacteraceae bacterium]